MFSVCLVCGVHCVMAKGTVTAGMVLAFFSLPASLCFTALTVVADAVPASGCTNCTSCCADIEIEYSNTGIKNILFKTII